jgi:hypothetical protein
VVARPGFSAAVTGVLVVFLGSLTVFPVDPNPRFRWTLAHSLRPFHRKHGVCVSPPEQEKM